MVLSVEEAFEVEEVKLATKTLNKIILKPAQLLALVFFIIGIGFFCLSFAFNNDATIMSAGVFIMVFAIIYIVMIYFLSNKAVKNIKSALTYSYKFYDDRAIICASTANSNGNVVYKYDDFKKCVKKEHYTFLFINKNQAYILRNQDLTEEFVNLLKTNIKNYKE